MKVKFDNYNTSWKLVSSKDVTESHPVEVKYDIAHIIKDTPAYNGGCRKQYGNEIGMFISQSLNHQGDTRIWYYSQSLNHLDKAKIRYWNSQTWIEITWCKAYANGID